MIEAVMDAYAEKIEDGEGISLGEENIFVIFFGC
jgi:hypothetical protein